MVAEYSEYDRHQRILGVVLLNGDELNLEQVKAGMTWHYKKYRCLERIHHYQVSGCQF